MSFEHAVTTHLSAMSRDRLRRAAKDTGMSVAGWVRSLIVNELAHAELAEHTSPPDVTVESNGEHDDMLDDGVQLIRYELPQVRDTNPENEKARTALRNATVLNSNVCPECGAVGVLAEAFPMMEYIPTSNIASKPRSRTVVHSVSLPSLTRFTLVVRHKAGCPAR